MKLTIEVNDKIYAAYKRAFERQNIVETIEEVTVSVVERSMKNTIEIYNEFVIEK